MNTPKVKITKDQFYRYGGLSNPKLFRKARKSGGYDHYQIVD